MARNGVGVQIPPASSWNTAITGAAATPADWNALLADLTAVLTQSISADGQTPIVGNLAMAGFKLTGLGAGTAAGNTVRFEQLFSQGIELALASAATTDIGSLSTNFINVTGTTGITSLGVNYNGPKFLRFSGALTLTNSATLVCPYGNNITTIAGTTLIAYPIGNPAAGWAINYYVNTTNAILTTPTVTNGTFTSYTETVYNLGTGAAFSPAFANGSLQYLTTNANTTITLPAATAGKTIVIEVIYGGAHTITFAGGTTIVYSATAAPIATSVLNKRDIYICTGSMDGTKTIIRDGGRNF